MFKNILWRMQWHPHSICTFEVFRPPQNGSVFVAVSAVLEERKDLILTIWIIPIALVSTSVPMTTLKISTSAKSRKVLSSEMVLTKMASPTVMKMLDPHHFSWKYMRCFQPPWKSFLQLTLTRTHGFWLVEFRASRLCAIETCRYDYQKGETGYC